MTFVITQADTGVAKIWIKLNGAQHSSYYGAVMSFSGSGAYGIKNVQNNAIAVFADSVYSNVALTGIMESGFANRPYTDAECATLVTSLDDKYKYKKELKWE